MKRFVLIIGTVALAQLCAAQAMALSDLTALLDAAASRKIETALQKKGFRNTFSPQSEDYIESFAWEGKGKLKERGPADHFVHVCRENQLVYQINSPAENSALLKEIQRAGFKGVASADSSSFFYQHLDMRVECWREKADSGMNYLLRFSKKNLPKRKNIVVAEDLLQLDSEEYLAEVFGKQSLRADYFFYTEKDSNRCTVLFPKTALEAIFVWKDEKNNKDLAFIMIGGNLRGSMGAKETKAVANNLWMSRQGVYCGMSLTEVQILNKNPLLFHNWNSESAGHLATKNKGSLDFNTLGLVFNCLNCDFVSVEQQELTDSQKSIAQSQKVFVSSLVILPEKK